MYVFTLSDSLDEGRRRDKILMRSVCVWVDLKEDEYEEVNEDAAYAFSSFFLSTSDFLFAELDFPSRN